MTEMARYRRLPWPNDRRGVRVGDAAQQLGLSWQEVYRLVDAGTLAIWRSPETRGSWLDADEVNAYAADLDRDGPGRAAPT